MIRFWSKVDKRGPDECWEWTGCKREGYGRFWDGKRMVQATHFVWEFHTGQKVLKGMDVCHRCDNRVCVNPNHLFIGTRKDNMRDCVRKERQARGRDHGHSKLTDQDVIQIRNNPGTQEQIATEYGVIRQTISKIKRLERWRHI